MTVLVNDYLSIIQVLEYTCGLGGIYTRTATKYCNLSSEINMVSICKYGRISRGVDC